MYSTVTVTGTDQALVPSLDWLVMYSTVTVTGTEQAFRFLVTGE